MLLHEFQYLKLQLYRLALICLLRIEKNNNICTVQSESSTFASLSFDQGFPNNTRLQRHIADCNAIWQYFASIKLLFILSILAHLVSDEKKSHQWSDQKVKMKTSVSLLLWPLSQPLSASKITFSCCVTSSSRGCLEAA